ncbi:hypothetical protein C3F09_03310 [candidate division GN15 bacterium]|uniref:Uncharacterized protein n=1 Tax=candidate division GN15 bacterium TaxID=2072418 RepID=A0A855X4F4_9BACT|nr:MAG: hypothetical protein C3F09_03310 [candidate division GN15 bacterium]
MGTDSNVIDLAPNAIGEAISPEGNGHRTCKFILLRHHGSNVLVFGDVATYRYHANLLHEYCRQRGIETSWVHKPDLLESTDPMLSVLGGGFLELTTDGRSATFSGSSKAYGPYPWRLLESIIVTSPVFAAMKVRVES